MNVADGESRNYREGQRELYIYIVSIGIQHIFTKGEKKTIEITLTVPNKSEVPVLNLLACNITYHHLIKYEVTILSPALMFAIYEYVERLHFLMFSVSSRHNDVFMVWLGFGSNHIKTLTLGVGKA